MKNNSIITSSKTPNLDGIFSKGLAGRSAFSSLTVKFKSEQLEPAFLIYKKESQ